MQREENMFRVPLCWMCVHCKIHYTYYYDYIVITFKRLQLTVERIPVRVDVTETIYR